jgi:hypothetical protein
MFNKNYMTPKTYGDDPPFANRSWGTGLFGKISYEEVNTF